MMSINSVCRVRNEFGARRSVRLLSLPWFWLAAALSLCWAGTTSGADPILQVEEDWEVRISTPETKATSPQIYVVISPYGNINNVHSIFELNHSTQPNYTAGGMQIQSWDGNHVLEHKKNTKTAKLSNVDEVIKFTLVMKIKNGNLVFEVTNGTSTTWGAFGGQGYLKTIIPTFPNDLNAYSPDLSILQSKIGFAKHRVKLFARNEVRKYSAAGLVSKETKQCVVHQLSEDN